jgi:putative PIN family toxin of toxin-antitoxin system
VRLVIDTNILISGLLSETSLPAHMIVLWREGKFELLTSAEQLDELMRVTRYPKIRERLAPALAGRLIGEMRDIATLLPKLPIVTASEDTDDNYLLAMALAGAADFLVTGDKRDLLSLKIFEGTKIVTVRDFLALHKRLLR